MANRRPTPHDLIAELRAQARALAAAADALDWEEFQNRPYNDELSGPIPNALRRVRETYHALVQWRPPDAPPPVEYDVVFVPQEPRQRREEPGSYDVVFYDSRKVSPSR